MPWDRNNSVEKNLEDLEKNLEKTESAFLYELKTITHDSNDGYA
jgi:hypothetical protein